MGIAGFTEECHGKYMKLRSKEESEEIGSECRLSLHGRLVVVYPGSSWRMTWAEGDGVSRLRISQIREVRVKKIRR